MAHPHVLVVLIDPCVLLLGTWKCWKVQWVCPPENSAMQKLSSSSSKFGLVSQHLLLAYIYILYSVVSFCSLIVSNKVKHLFVCHQSTVGLFHLWLWGNMVWLWDHKLSVTVWANMVWDHKLSVTMWANMVWDLKWSFVGHSTKFCRNPVPAK